MPSHHHVLISCFRWPILNSNITKGNVCCRERKIQTKPGLAEPPSPLCMKRLGGPPLVSFVYMSTYWWELTGKLPLRSERSAVQIPSGGKICTTGRWWFLKGLSLWQRRIRFVKGRILRGLENALLTPAHS